MSVYCSVFRELSRAERRATLCRCHPRCHPSSPPSVGACTTAMGEMNHGNNTYVFRNVWNWTKSCEFLDESYAESLLFLFVNCSLSYIHARARARSILPSLVSLISRVWNVFWSRTSNTTKSRIRQRIIEHPNRSMIISCLLRPPLGYTEDILDYERWFSIFQRFIKREELSRFYDITCA